MRANKKLIIALLITAAFLSGCNMRTFDEMYCLPKRSEAYANLQSQIDQVMLGLEYSAPLSGENRQTVQIVDLNGDGMDEYLLFAKDSSDIPLQIFIFSGDGENYFLLDTIQCTGSAFEQVEYIQMDGRGGAEIVLGRQVNDQVLRNVSVYTLIDGQIEQLMTAGYSKFVSCNLDNDEFSELLLLRPGENSTDNGIAELYSITNGSMERSQEVSMSEPSDAIKRIMVGKLNDGASAVYVASDVDGGAIITDVYSLVDGVFTNVSFSNESGTSVQTLRNYYVYADDIDEDGVLELPDLITGRFPGNIAASENQHLIRWYAMESDGTEVDKMCTYHNFVGGWYMQLDNDLAYRMNVIQQGNSYEFCVWDFEKMSNQRLMSIYILTGQKREEQALIDNRFVLYRSESTVYAANLDVSSAAYGISKDSLISSFHLIRYDWNTGET